MHVLSVCCIGKLTTYLISYRSMHVEKHVKQDKTWPNHNSPLSFIYFRSVIISHSNIKAINEQSDDFHRGRWENHQFILKLTVH